MSKRVRRISITEHAQDACEVRREKKRRSVCVCVCVWHNTPSLTTHTFFTPHAYFSLPLSSLLLLVPPSVFLLPHPSFLLPRLCRKGVKAGRVWEGGCHGGAFDGVPCMPWDMSALPRDGERRGLLCTVTVVCVCVCIVCCVLFIVYFQTCVSVCRSVCFHTST